MPKKVALQKKHSPLPWRVFNSDYVAASDSKTVCIPPPTSSNFGTARAMLDAALIVKAVNAYAHLLQTSALVAEVQAENESLKTENARLSGKLKELKDAVLSEED